MTFAKSIANGFPSRDDRDRRSRQRLHRFVAVDVRRQPISMAAVDVTMDVMERENSHSGPRCAVRSCVMPLRNSRNGSHSSAMCAHGPHAGIELVEDRKTKERHPRRPVRCWKRRKAGLLIGKADSTATCCGSRRPCSSASRHR